MILEKLKKAKVYEGTIETIEHFVVFPHQPLGKDDPERVETHDYPWGRYDRTTRQWWLEFAARGGASHEKGDMRVAYRTLDPKKKKFAADKKSTYGAAYLLGKDVRNGHIVHVGLSRYGDPVELYEYWRDELIPHLKEGERDRYMQIVNGLIKAKSKRAKTQKVSETLPSPEEVAEIPVKPTEVLPKPGQIDPISEKYKDHRFIQLCQHIRELLLTPNWGDDTKETSSDTYLDVQSLVMQAGQAQGLEEIYALDFGNKVAECLVGETATGDSLPILPPSLDRYFKECLKDQERFKDAVLLFTDAEPSYDWRASTRHVDTTEYKAKAKGNYLRKVLVLPDQVQNQRDRYGSGLRLSLTADEFDEWLENGFPIETDTNGNEHSVLSGIPTEPAVDDSQDLGIEEVEVDDAAIETEPIAWSSEEPETGPESEPTEFYETEIRSINSEPDPVTEAIAAVGLPIEEVQPSAQDEPVDPFDIEAFSKKLVEMLQDWTQLVFLEDKIQEIPNLKPRQVTELQGKIASAHSEDENWGVELAAQIIREFLEALKKNPKTSKVRKFREPKAQKEAVLTIDIRAMHNNGDRIISVLRTVSEQGGELASECQSIIDEIMVLKKPGGRKRKGKNPEEQAQLNAERMEINLRVYEWSNEIGANGKPKGPRYAADQSCSHGQKMGASTVGQICTTLTNIYFASPIIREYVDSGKISWSRIYGTRGVHDQSALQELEAELEKELNDAG